ncbi:MAG: glycosyltransferase family 4 protein, partial [Patescibacteria group bacterium]
YFFGQYRRMFGLENKLADFDVAHTAELFNYYTYQAVMAKKANKKLKVVALVWENSFGRFEYNYWPGFKMPPKYWRDRLNKIIETNVKGVDMFLPATHDAADLLMDFGVPKERITVVAPGIVTAPDGGNGLPEFAGKEVYLMVNRLVKEKGVYDVLYAWRRYLRMVSGSSKKILLIIGTGPEEENMRRIVKEWGLESKIVFIRQIPYEKILGVYKGAKCLILSSIPNPTWQEQFGYVLAEAICAGTPIIASYCGAIPEVVGEAGLLVTPAHPIDLSNALLKIDDATVYSRLKAGCEIEKKKYDAIDYANKVSSIYRSLIGWV